VTHEDDHLERDLSADSLDIVEIAMEVEEHFDISVPDEQSESPRTVRQIVDAVLPLLEP